MAKVPCLNFQYEEYPEKVNEAIPFIGGGTDQPSTKNTVQPLKVIVKYGNLEEQTDNIIAAPLLAREAKLENLNVTKSLQHAAGDKFSKLFNFALNGRTALPAGSLFEMPLSQETYSLKCELVAFIVLDPWNGSTGSSAKDLKKGIHNLLAKCNTNNSESIAMSAISTGTVLAFPPTEAATIIGEEIKSFVERNPNTSIKKIQIVIQQHQENEPIFIAFSETLSEIDFGNQVIVCNEQGAPFPRTQWGDSIHKQVGKLLVCVVYGDILQESTDAIVNSTNFTVWKEGSVANAIFSATGQEVIQEAQRGHKSGKKVVMTGSANLKCNWILHCDCQKNVKTLKGLVKDIFKLCDNTGLRSISIPAIGTGECSLSPKCVAETIIKVISKISQKTENRELNVRLITCTPYIYHVFCAELQKLL